MENPSPQPAAHPLANVISVYRAAKTACEDAQAALEAAEATFGKAAAASAAATAKRMEAERKYWIMFTFQQELQVLRERHQAVSDQRDNAQKTLLAGGDAGCVQMVEQAALDMRRYTLHMVALMDEGIAKQKAKLESMGDFSTVRCPFDCELLYAQRDSHDRAQRSEAAATAHRQEAFAASKEAFGAQWRTQRQFETATKELLQAAEKHALEQEIDSVEI